jgi:hypothetical protein
MTEEHRPIASVVFARLILHAATFALDMILPSLAPR